MFFINLKSQNILKGYTSNSFNFPAAVYLKKKSTISNSYRRVCGGSPYTHMLSLSTIAELQGYARTVQ